MKHSIFMANSNKKSFLRKKKLTLRQRFGDLNVAKAFRVLEDKRREWWWWWGEEDSDEVFFAIAKKKPQQEAVDSVRFFPEDMIDFSEREDILSLYDNVNDEWSNEPDDELEHLAYYWDAMRDLSFRAGWIFDRVPILDEYTTYGMTKQQWVFFMFDWHWRRPISYLHFTLFRFLYSVRWFFDMRYLRLCARAASLHSWSFFPASSFLRHDAATKSDGLWLLVRLICFGAVAISVLLYVQSLDDHTATPYASVLFVAVVFYVAGSILLSLLRPHVFAMLTVFIGFLSLLSYSVQASSDLSAGSYHETATALANPEIDFSLLLYGGVVFGILVCAIIGASFLLAPREFGVAKIEPYECGFEPYGDAHSHFDVHFYIVGILFLIFDLEIVFLFPWFFAVGDLTCVRSMFGAVLFFLLVLGIGFLYEWAVGALDWAPKVKRYATT
jgi:NADH-quinone oxidoreductase subunit A